MITEQVDYSRRKPFNPKVRSPKKVLQVDSQKPLCSPCPSSEVCSFSELNVILIGLVSAQFHAWEMNYDPSNMLKQKKLGMLKNKVIQISKTCFRLECNVCETKLVQNLIKMWIFIVLCLSRSFPPIRMILSYLELSGFEGKLVLNWLKGWSTTLTLNWVAAVVCSCQFPLQCG